MIQLTVGYDFHVDVDVGYTVDSWSKVLIELEQLIQPLCLEF